MGFKDQMALMAAPIFLRLAVAITFLWAGSGKMFQTIDVSGADAAYLANMGALDLTQLQAKPSAMMPQGDDRVLLPALAQTAPATPTTSARAFVASDFPTPIKARATYQLSLLLRNAADPGTDDKGVAKMKLWPPALAQGQWTRWLAVTVMLTELVGGGLVLVGLFTRLWGFLLAGTMMGAMWLTLIGPAIQSGNTRLGFLPADLGPFDMGWMKWFWVFGLVMSCLALWCSGSGAWSLDSVMTPSKPSGGGRPAAAPPKPAQ